jgi:hypothetical protein
MTFPREVAVQRMLGGGEGRAVVYQRWRIAGGIVRSS